MCRFFGDADGLYKTENQLYVALASAFLRLNAEIKKRVWSEEGFNFYEITKRKEILLLLQEKGPVEKGGGPREAAAHDPTPLPRFLLKLAFYQLAMIVKSNLQKEIFLNPIQDGFFQGCSRMGGEAKRPLVPKICRTNPAMIKLGTVIPYLKEIQNKYESRATPLEVW